MATLEYGEITRDSDKLAPAVVEALMQEGFTHWFGNRVSSNVVGQIKMQIGKATNTKASEVTTAQVKQFRETNPDDVAKMVADITAGILAKIDAGEVPFERSSGGGGRESLTPLVREMRRIAEAELVAVFAANGYELPNATGKVSMGGKEYTRLDLIKMRVANPAHADRLKSEAERALAALERSAQRHAGDQSGDLAALLGIAA